MWKIHKLVYVCLKNSQTDTEKRWFLAFFGNFDIISKFPSNNWHHNKRKHPAIEESLPRYTCFVYFIYCYVVNLGHQRTKFYYMKNYSHEVVKCLNIQNIFFTFKLDLILKKKDPFIFKIPEFWIRNMWHEFL